MAEVAKIAVICARGGSKRLPRKNLAIFHGEPLIARCVKVCLQVPFDDVIVSTEDDEIAEVAGNAGALVHDRSVENSLDSVPKAYAVREAVLWYEALKKTPVIEVYSIQANSPTLTAEVIEDVRMLMTSGRYGEVSTVFSDLRQNPAVRAFRRSNLFDDFYSTNSAYVYFDGEDVHTLAELELLLQTDR